MSDYNSQKKNKKRFDDLSKCMLVIALILLVTSLIFNYWFISIAAVVILLISLYRIYSKNIYRRYNENMVYNEFVTSVKKNINDIKKRHADKKTHMIVKCPNCRQKIRLPRHKNTLLIKCPACRIEFKKDTGRK